MALLNVFKDVKVTSEEVNEDFKGEWTSYYKMNII